MKVEATIRRKEITDNRVSIECPDNTPKGEIARLLFEEADFNEDDSEEISSESFILASDRHCEYPVMINGEVSRIFDEEAR